MILVTGATGRVGRHVCAQLLAKGRSIRTLCRNPHAAGLPPEVEIVAGDLTHSATLDPALDGIDAVFLVWTAPSINLAGAIASIAKHARRIVFLSSPYQTAHPFFQAAQPNSISLLHAEIERLIKDSGLAWTFLRPGMFASNAETWWSGQIRAGDVVRWPYALAQTAPIDEHDIAAMAVRALCDDTCTNADHVLTGPESLTHADQVSILGDVLGRSLRFEEIEPEEWCREFPHFAPVAKMLLDAWAAAVGQPALITSTVAQITGTPPRTFRDWVADHTTKFREFSPSPGTTPGSGVARHILAEAD